MTRETYKKARRLYTEGYGLSWIQKHTGLDIAAIHRAVRLRLNEQGPLVVIEGTEWNTQ